MDSLDQCIVNACKNSWDKSYLAGTPNKDNCSGFVQSVAAELGVPMPRGNANAMVDGLEQSWTKLASGAEAAQKAAQGFLVIAGLPHLRARRGGHQRSAVSAEVPDVLVRQHRRRGRPEPGPEVGRPGVESHRPRPPQLLRLLPGQLQPAQGQLIQAVLRMSQTHSQHDSPRASRLHSPVPSPPACALRPPHSARILRQNGARDFSGPRMNILQLE